MPPHSWRSEPWRWWWSSAAGRWDDEVSATDARDEEVSDPWHRFTAGRARPPQPKPRVGPPLRCKKLSKLCKNFARRCMHLSKEHHLACLKAGENFDAQAFVDVEVNYETYLAKRTQNESKAPDTPEQNVPANSHGCRQVPLGALQV